MPDEITPIEIPSSLAGIDWAALGEDERGTILDQTFSGIEAPTITELAEQVLTEVAELNADRTPENIERMTSLAAYLEVIDAESGRRAAAQAALDEAADGIMSRFAPEAETAEVVAEPEVEAVEVEPEVEAIEAEVVPEAAAASAIPAATGPTGAALAAAVADRAAQRSSSRVAPPAAVAAEVAAPAITAPTGRLAATASARTNLLDMAEGTEFGSLIDLAQVVVAKRNALQNRMGSVRDDRISLAHGTIDWAGTPKASPDAVENILPFSVISEQTTTIVASGGNCAIAAPRYQIEGFARIHTPVEDSIPVINADRGAIRFIPTPDFADVRSGIGVTTNAEDAAGYGSGSGEATPKPCVHVDCPAIKTVEVDAISQCIEFGNLTYERTSPEWVARRLADLAVNFGQVTETFYLDQIDDGSTAPSAYTFGYGAYRNTLTNLAESGHQYRKSQAMDVDATLDWLAPDFMLRQLQADLINDQAWGGNLGQFATRGEIEDHINELGINVVWYYDSATGEDMAFSDAFEDDAAGLSFPTSAVTYLYAPGTWIRLDAGTLDLGVVRDSVLNQTNDVQIFAERWIALAKVGALSLKLTISGLCANGAAPAGVTAVTCS